MDSFITQASIQGIAHSIDIPKLSDEAAKALSPDVNYRLREIIQDALKFARQAKRTTLTVEDVNNALKLRNFEPIYGFGNKDPAKFVRATGHPDVYILHDRELTFEQLLDEPLPRPPVEIGLAPHWLFINGVQPAIPENTPISRPVSKRSTAQRSKASGKASAADHPAASPLPDAAPTVAAASGSAAALASSLVQLQQPVAHLLSKELQLYFDKVVLLLKTPVPDKEALGEAAAAVDTQQSSAEVVRLQRAALTSLSTDPGLHPLAPYFTKFIADEVAASLRNLSALHTVLHMVSALLSNPAMKLEHYIHQLLPPVLTCLVAKSLGSHSQEDHWAVRDAASQVVKQVCGRYSDPFFNIQPRISKTLIKAFLDPTKPLATHYGAVIGLAALGHASVSLLLVPQLQPYMARLRAVMDDASKPARRAEAYRVHGALLDAVSAAMYERLLQATSSCLPTRAAAPRVCKTSTAQPSHVPDTATDAQGDVEMKDAQTVSDKQGPGGRPGASSQQQGPGQGPGGSQLEGPSSGTGTGAAGANEVLEDGNAGLVQSILAQSWREEADLNQVMWALQQLFHEELLARMPSSHCTAYCL